MDEVNSNINEDAIWACFLSFVDHCKRTKISIPRVVAGIGNTSEEHSTPLSIDGFKRFAWEQFGDLSQWLSSDSDNSKRILNHINSSLIEGSLVGLYKDSLVQKLTDIFSQDADGIVRDITVKIVKNEH